MVDNKGYTFTGKPGNAEPTPKDTDLSHDSPHHTLGKGPLNASAGNHTHTANEVGLAAHTHPSSEVPTGIFPTSQLGTGTANADKYLRGDGTWQTKDPQVWDDLRVSLSTAKPGVTSPSYDTFIDGVEAYAFSKTVEQSVQFEVQLPHSWVQGTELRPHIHWSPGASTDTGVVRWALEYTWANPVASPGNVFPNTVTLTGDQAAAGAYHHQITSFGTISGTGKRVSSVLVCRLSRVGNASQDTFDDVAFGLSVDFHILNSGDGSVDEYPGA